ncbi:O-succinylbenzoic acid--CoA ligase [Corynebacterium kutscheri]|uniref:Acyl-CoA synthetase (AMP-forming)/AMP-acid ligase II n=1 Tax=Corynebacterium kutscheri TaxID=35755 RepID=A0A0F6QZ38_9CORY|nr:o-succinylbenzoate--CoA ligase [Corynebacterium kutscheri]AKE40500.1 acyl-CoA synthetase (AMP-forming)/AMP-acid ligase II [Corynebacterium kutscheri]VEH05079.1 O-succinylbenzoic acid--CoA ligase [Corynebacterium kutscheri]VEH10895.1 O-succinylbenzoic acid--CoA ligase [Corynebacterium kutscheri]VEH80628.1 O-succinylbenzoic acid--CoA ligase [Corynebacterium kutscheri]
MLLESFTVNPKNLTPFLDALEEAIVGSRSLLPVPAHDPGQAQLLKNTQAVGQPIDEEIALVVSTSGSTGTPKGAMLTAANLISSADATHQFLGGAGDWLLAMPAHYIAGIQVLVRCLVTGAYPMVVDVSQGFNIEHFANSTNLLRQESNRIYTSLTPMQLLKAMNTLVGIEALRLYDAILIGGAPLRADDRRAAKELGINLVTTYGSSETAGGVIYDGFCLPGAKVRLVGERIHLGGPMIAKGYRNIDSLAFHNDWFITNDTGYFDEGKLIVTGRLDTIIDSGGLKIHPEVIERALTDHPKVSAACVVGIPDDRLGQAIAAAYVGSLSPEEIIEILSDLPRWQLPRQLKRVQSLPLTASGKIDRQAVLNFLSA